MPPLFSKLTSFFPPVITDREKANNARNLARINMRSDERVEDSIERRLACLKNLNDKRLELKNQKLREARNLTFVSTYSVHIYSTSNGLTVTCTVLLHSALKNVE